jgi:hypothetical protein
LYSVNKISQISKDHAQAAEQVLNLIEVISENHPRFEIYGKLPPDPILQIALLNIFTDVVEFSARAIRFFKRNALGLFSLVLDDNYLLIDTLQPGRQGSSYVLLKRSSEISLIVSNDERRLSISQPWQPNCCALPNPVKVLA